MQLLDQTKIEQKIQRLAIEILEHNYTEKQLILAGINNNGMAFATLLHDRLAELTDIELVLTQLRLNPADPLERVIELDFPLKKLKNKVIIIVDDVANTGRTIFYAFKPLMDVLPKKVEVAVLVDRKHKSFPVRVDYVGLSLATTLNNDIEVNIKDKKKKAVFLH